MRFVFQGFSLFHVRCAFGKFNVDLLWVWQVSCGCLGRPTKVLGPEVSVSGFRVLRAHVHIAD